MEKTKLIELREEAYTWRDKLTEQHNTIKGDFIYGEETYYRHTLRALDEWIDMLHKQIVKQ